MIECIFGWGKQHGTMRKAMHRGIARVAAGISAEPHRLQPYTHPEIDRCLAELPQRHLRSLCHGEPNIQFTSTRCHTGTAKRGISGFFSKLLERFSLDCIVTCGGEEVCAFLRGEVIEQAPIVSQRASTVRSAVFRRCAFSFEKAFSIGLKSGLYGGR